MKLIVACDPKGGIGLNNKLPWDRIEGDLPRFKQLTSGKSILMGRNTWESLPVKPLPNRKNFVISSKPISDAIVVKTIEEVKEDVWLIGGARAIELCWPKVKEIHLSVTNQTYTCDTFIDLSKVEKEFMCIFSEKFKDHTYEIWRRK